jgi:hypothetical protein
MTVAATVIQHRPQADDARIEQRIFERFAALVRLLDEVRTRRQ